MLPAVGLALGLAAVFEVVLFKWSIIGRYRPRIEPYWGTWVRAPNSSRACSRPWPPRWWPCCRHTPAPADSSPVRHARRTAGLPHDSGGTEFDLITIGDDAVISPGAITQTHLFEDRVMKMSRVEVGPGATVGAGSVVLYDASVEPGDCLDALSLVMKGETLPAGSRWRGIPARPT